MDRGNLSCIGPKMEEDRLRRHRQAVCRPPPADNLPPQAEPASKLSRDWITWLPIVQRGREQAGAW